MGAPDDIVAAPGSLLPHGHRPALAGLRVLVPESRELDLFASMLEKAGAAVRRCPLVTILDVEDDGPVTAWLHRLIGGRMDDLVLYTGEGLKRLLGVAGRGGIENETVAALGRIRKIVRGPKPTRVLRTLGLAPDSTAEEATTAGLIETVSALPLAGRRIGVQLYPEQPGEFVDLLTRRGATVDTVLPYRYADHYADRQVGDAILAMATGGVDVVAFTSTPQVRRLDEVARDLGLLAELKQAMERVRVAAVGPVTSEALRKSGWRDIVAPEDNYHLKPFIAAIGRTMAAADPT